MMRAALMMMALAPAYVFAAMPGSECASPGGYVEGMLLTHMKNDLGIDLTSIQYNKTTVEVLDVKPVSDFFARTLAIADSKNNAVAALTEQQYYGIYHESHVVNVTAKYTFTNKENKRSTFISSALANDDECSVRYNGYLTLSREF
ncbi:TPA: Shiga toxin A subunit [Enterobacter chengduensis]|nr:Shiga toxin A subunit [Enterobacter chengduensis]